MALITPRSSSLTSSTHSQDRLAPSPTPLRGREREQRQATPTSPILLQFPLPPQNLGQRLLNTREAGSPEMHDRSLLYSNPTSPKSSSRPTPAESSTSLVEFGHGRESPTPSYAVDHDVSRAQPASPSAKKPRRPTSPPITARRLRSILRRTESSPVLQTNSVSSTPPVPGLDAELDRLRRENAWLREALVRERQNAAKDREALLQLRMTPTSQQPPSLKDSVPNSPLEPSRSRSAREIPCDGMLLVPRRVDSLMSVKSSSPPPLSGRGHAFSGALDDRFSAPSGADKQQQQQEEQQLTSSLAARRLRRQGRIQAWHIATAATDVDHVQSQPCSVPRETAHMQQRGCKYDTTSDQSAKPPTIRVLDDQRGEAARDEEACHPHEDSESTYSLDALIFDDDGFALPHFRLDEPCRESATRSTGTRPFCGEARIPKFSNQRNIARRVTPVPAPDDPIQGNWASGDYFGRQESTREALSS